MRLHRLALLCAAGWLAACSADEVDVDSAAVTRANGALPAELQQDLRVCEAVVAKRYPLFEPAVGYGATPYEWTCRGDRCLHVSTTAPYGPRDRYRQARRKAVRACMAAKGYSVLTVRECRPEEIPGRSYRLGSATAASCAARVRDGGWVAVTP